MRLSTISMSRMTTSTCRRITSKTHQSNKPPSSPRFKRLKRTKSSTRTWAPKQQTWWKKRKGTITNGTTKKLRLKSPCPKKCRKRTSWSSFWSNRWRRPSRRAKPPKWTGRWTHATSLWGLSAPTWLFRTPSRRTSHSITLSTTWQRIVFLRRYILICSRNSRTRRCKSSTPIQQRASWKSKRRRRRNSRPRVKPHKRPEEALLCLNLQRSTSHQQLNNPSLKKPKNPRKPKGKTRKRRARKRRPSSPLRSPKKYLSKSPCSKWCRRTLTVVNLTLSPLKRSSDCRISLSKRIKTK